MESRYSLDTLCAALTYAMGIDTPAQANTACPDLVSYVDKALGGGVTRSLNLDAHGKCLCSYLGEMEI